MRAFAARLDVHGIRPGWTTWLDDDTIVCRCESVRKATIDEYAAASSRGMRLATRAGLGACQGRTCGRSVADILGTKPSFDSRPVFDHRPVLIDQPRQLDADDPAMIRDAFGANGMAAAAFAARMNQLNAK